MKLHSSVPVIYPNRGHQGRDQTRREHHPTDTMTGGLVQVGGGKKWSSVCSFVEITKLTTTSTCGAGPQKMNELQFLTLQNRGRAGANYVIGEPPHSPPKLQPIQSPSLNWRHPVFFSMQVFPWVKRAPTNPSSSSFAHNLNDVRCTH